MFWSVQSADLNHIEMVWDELQRKVRGKQPTSAAYLGQIWQKCWVELTSVYLPSLLERMPRICEPVTAFKAGHFDESNNQKVFLCIFSLICI